MLRERGVAVSELVHYASRLFPPRSLPPSPIRRWARPLCSSWEVCTVTSEANLVTCTKCVRLLANQVEAALGD